MSTRLKIHGGTRSDLSRRLCDTCHSGVVRKGASDNQIHIHCLLTEQRIERTVIECNRYVDRSQPSIWDMRQIAWVLEVDARRQRIGFVRAGEWERKHDDEELIPPHIG